MALNNSSTGSGQWKIELAVIAILMVLSLIVFHNGKLDLAISAQFYHPDQPFAWPLANNAFWGFLHKWAAAFVATLFLGSLGIIVFLRRNSVMVRRARLYAVYILLVTMLGPGLLINGVLKGHWGRPRPSQTLTLGGDQAYVPPLQMGPSANFKSFPAGHSSVGFLFVVFWFLFRRRRPILATSALIISVIAGFLFGMGRIVVGAHYFSDVLWAGLLTVLTASLVYHFVLRVPQREARIERKDLAVIPALTPWKIAGYSSLAIGMIIASLLAYEINIPINRFSTLSAGDAEEKYVVNLWVDHGKVNIVYDPQAPHLLHIDGRARGYGLPTNQVEVLLQNHAHELDAHVQHKGIYAELFSHYTVTINNRRLLKLNLHTGKDVKVINRPAAVASNRLP